LPEYSEIRSREDFWDLAIQMAIEHPVSGVGPFQWNYERYRYRSSPPLVADAHNAYFQTAAEYGLLVAALYLLLLGACIAIVVRAARDRTAWTRTDWTVAALVAAAFAYTLADVTNSNLFNVRMGLVGWLLIAVAVACAAASHRDNRTDPVPAVVS
jgi:O-antigen ligase